LVLTQSSVKAHQQIEPLHRALKSLVKVVRAVSAAVIYNVDGSSSCDIVEPYEAGKFGGATVVILDSNTGVTVSHAFPQSFVGKNVCLYTEEGFLTSARVSAIDERWDLAFLEFDAKIDTNLAEVIQLKALDSIEAGLLIVGGGYNARYLRFVVDVGIVSSERLRAVIEDRVLDGLILTSLRSLPGMSGGLVVDIEGNPVGLIVGTWIDAALFNSVGSLVLPFDRVLRTYRIFKKFGKIVRPRLGVYLKEEFDGLLILDIFDSSPLAACNVSRGDKIIQVNNVPVRSLNELWRLLDLAAIEGRDIKVDIRDRIRGTIITCYLPSPSK